VVTTSDIAETVDCSKESARQKLTTLYEADRIDRRRSGQSFVWWRVTPETAEERPERQLCRLSQEIEEPIVVGDIVYENGETRLLSDAATATVENAVAEGDDDD
jgi:predicted ArsR family transcriptional regulator